MKTILYGTEDKEMMKRVKKLLSRVTMSCLGRELSFIIDTDKVDGTRVYIQVQYSAPCTHGGAQDVWKGEKRYLSRHMIDDEIIKKAYSAFELCIRHELMEGFKVDGKVLFNPHVDFEELLKISHKEVKRK